jgi:hypothetical protein
MKCNGIANSCRKSLLLFSFHLDLLCGPALPCISRVLIFPYAAWLDNPELVHDIFPRQSSNQRFDSVVEIFGPGSWRKTKDCNSMLLIRLEQQGIAEIQVQRHKAALLLAAD